MSNDANHYWIKVGNVIRHKYGGAHWWKVLCPLNREPACQMYK